MGNLCGIGAVLHEKQLDVLDVMDKECLVAGRGHVPSLLVGAEADRGHNHVTLEAPSDTVVYSLGLTPAGIDALEQVTLMAVEALGALLHDRNVLPCDNHFGRSTIDI